MKKLSALIPVYNEENLLRHCLAAIVDHVDQVVIVDGSADGYSTDKSRAVCEEIADTKLVYLQPKIGKKWSLESNKQAGLEEVTGDYLMLLSADMIVVGLDRCVELLRSSQEEVVVSTSHIELWFDINHAREIRKETLIKPANEYGMERPEDKRKIFVPNITRYHLGWIRPFAAQVKKHIRNLKNGGWGELGKQVVALGDRATEAWCIHHVLGYKNTDCISILPHAELHVFGDWSYLDGVKQYVSDYESKYKEEFYTSIMQLVPQEMIVA